MFQEFSDFLKKYGVVGLVIAVVIGGKRNDFITATVSDLLMPVVGSLLPEGDWKQWVLTLGSIKFGIGHWLGVAIDFIIVAFVVFMFAKIVMKGKDEKDVVTK